MRPLVGLVLALLLAGCGGNETTAPAPPGDPSTTPPPYLLESEAGSQSATQGSSCVMSDEKSGMFGGVCVDVGLSLPERVSVVRPDETITISMPGAALAGASARVHPLGCRSRTVARIALRTGVTSWRVPLPEGDYQLALFGRFTADDGRQGDSSALAGLRVSASDDLEVIELEAPEPGAC